MRAGPRRGETVELGLHRALERVEGEAPGVAAAVDEHGRGARGSAVGGAGQSRATRKANRRDFESATNRSTSRPRSAPCRPGRRVELALGAHRCRASPRTGPGRPPAPTPRPPSRRARGPRPVGGGGTRRPARPRTRATLLPTGSARPQYGHSKSPYSTSATGIGGAEDVVDLGIDRLGKVADGAPPGLAGRAPARAGRGHRGRPPRRPPRRGRARRGRPNLALSRSPPVNVMSAMSRDTVKPTPATAAAPTSRATAR